MIERLRSHLKKEQGFTLIELLVVIAIIAILVVIVIVAINPVQRIKDANTQAAASNANQIGKAVAACMTNKLTTNGMDAAIGLCDSFTNLSTGSYTNLSANPIGVTYNDIGAAPNRTDICVEAVVGNGSTSYFTYLTGQVTQAKPAGCT